MKKVVKQTEELVVTTNCIDFDNRFYAAEWTGVYYYLVCSNGRYYFRRTDGNGRLTSTSDSAREQIETTLGVKGAQVYEFKSLDEFIDWYKGVNPQKA